MINVPFRQSIDMYTGVTPPTISFLGTPSLSRLSSSFLTSSFGGKHTPEIFSSLLKPLLPTTSDDQQQQQQMQEEIKSSQSIRILPMQSRKSSLSVIPENKQVLMGCLYPSSAPSLRACSMVCLLFILILYFVYFAAIIGSFSSEIVFSIPKQR
jgi:hypothetical protein